MSEKVTFQELIDSIAKETNNSKKFTHDFLKDLVAVINSGLEQDGSVNIAGFGKFKLRRMEEREGYNPQTGEKMTIDAHNKVVFKPYKALREIVNAPYSDLEPELIKEEEEEQVDESQEVATDTSESDEISGEPERTDEEQGFIPTGPPPTVKTEEETEEEEEAPWDAGEATASEEDEMAEEAGKEDPFGITDSGMEEEEAEHEEETAKEEEEEDIVEFDEPEEQEREPSPLDLHLSKVKDKQDQESSGEESSAETGTEPEEQTEMRPEPEEEEEEAETESEPAEEPVPAMSAAKEDVRDEEESKSTFLPTVDKKSAPTWIWGAAAVIGLLIIVLAILYIGSGNGADEPAQTVATAQEQPQQQTEEVVQEPVTGDSESAEETPAETEARQESGAQMAGQEETQEEPLQLQTSDFVERSVSRGQTLWGLAEREYDDPYLWPWIYDANKASIRNPNIILVGQTLSIPVPDEPNNGLSTTDSLEVAKGYVETYRWYKNSGDDQAKYYLWAAKIYDQNVFDHITQPIDAEDLAFANRVR